MWKRLNNNLWEFKIPRVLLTVEKIDGDKYEATATITYPKESLDQSEDKILTRSDDSSTNLADAKICAVEIAKKLNEEFLAKLG